MCCNSTENSPSGSSTYAMNAKSGISGGNQSFPALLFIQSDAHVSKWTNQNNFFLCVYEQPISPSNNNLNMACYCLLLWKGKMLWEGNKYV